MLPGNEANTYRALAKDHFKQATETLASGNDNQLVYICLELRSCIEAISYGLLLAYHKELAASAFKSWTPRQVLSELEEADPRANVTRELRYGRQEQLGERAKVMRSLGVDHRLNPKWANKAYNALSNFLHVPTVTQLGRDPDATRTKIRDRCEKCVTVLRPVVESKIWHETFGQFYTFKCDCGFEVKRRTEVLKAKREATCWNCGQIFDVERFDGDSPFVVPRAALWDCRCGHENRLAFHLLKDNLPVVCSSCGAPAMVRSTWRVDQLDANLPPEGSTAGDRTDVGSAAGISGWTHYIVQRIKAFGATRIWRNSNGRNQSPYRIP